MDKDEIYKKIKVLFPLSAQEDTFAGLISGMKTNLYNKLADDEQPRYPGSYNLEMYERLITKYSHIKDNGTDHLVLLNEVIEDLFNGVPRWRSPRIMYNICASPNLAASAIYSLALEENIHNVNSGLSGDTLIAEHAITKILATLADLRTRPYGLFTFGGTSTNLYAIKMGIKKTDPDSTFKGLDGSVHILVTEDCHFSHASNADWLGIGLDNVWTIRADRDRTSNLDDANLKARQVLEMGHKLAAIIINGGTTYGHTIDDVEGFVRLRDRLVQEYRLEYKPHIHVDSVIGWSWLVFSGYDFVRNPLRISSEALSYVRNQYDKISALKTADSWGVDFHKGLGATPASSSIIMVNNFEDIALLSKKVSTKTEIHHLAHDFSEFSPVDYTLETTRAAGAALSALVTMQVLGLDGLRRNLANLVEQTILLRGLIAEAEGMFTLNADSEGFVTMVRLLQPGEKEKDIYQYTKSELEGGNRYLNDFFKWDKQTRIDQGIGIEYSVSSSYIKSPSGVSVAAIKLYPTSPHFDERNATEAVQTLVEQKKLFDQPVRQT